MTVVSSSSFHLVRRLRKPLAKMIGGLIVHSTAINEPRLITRHGDGPWEISSISIYWIDGSPEYIHKKKKKKRSKPETVSSWWQTNWRISSSGFFCAWQEVRGGGCCQQLAESCLLVWADPIRTRSGIPGDTHTVSTSFRLYFLRLSCSVWHGQKVDMTNWKRKTPYCFRPYCQLGRCAAPMA